MRFMMLAATEDSHHTDMAPLYKSQLVELC